MTETFGKRLEFAMQKKGWNATRLAAESGLTAGAISRHLERDEPPKPDSIEKYRKALEVNGEWLAYGRGDWKLGDGTLTLRESLGPAYVRLVGSEALERVLAEYEWPDVDIAIVDAVMADARAEASSTGKDRPESAWHLRVKQLLRERMGLAKEVPQRSQIKAADLTQESEEIRAGRKRPRRT